MARYLINMGHKPIAREGGLMTVQGPNANSRTRLYAVPVTAPDGTLQGYLETGSPLDRLDQSMARLRLLLAGMSVAGLLAALLGGWAIAGSALRPVTTMASTARAIALSRGFSSSSPTGQAGRTRTADSHLQ